MNIILDTGIKKQVMRRSNDATTRKTIVINKNTLESKTFISMAKASRTIGQSDNYINDHVRHRNPFQTENYLIFVGENKSW